MNMMKACIAVLALMASALPASAEDPQLTCFGNEPSWGLEFAGRGSARLVLPDLRPVYFRGSETRLDFLKERAWRGKVAGGKGGNLVAFLRESVCSDGMSRPRGMPCRLRRRRSRGRPGSLSACRVMIPARSAVRSVP